MTQWAWLRVWIVPEDRLIRSEVGPTGQTREHAHTVIQALLDSDPSLAHLSAAWTRGADDDTVYSGLDTWAILPHDGDPRAAASAWLHDYAATMRRGPGDARPGAGVGGLGRGSAGW